MNLNFGAFLLVVILLLPRGRPIVRTYFIPVSSYIQSYRFTHYGKIIISYQSTSFVFYTLIDSIEAQLSKVKSSHKKKFFY